MTEVMFVPKKKNRRKEKYARLKWEIARELHLDDELQTGKKMSAREAGRIGGQMVRRLVQAGGRSLSEDAGKNDPEVQERESQPKTSQ